MEPALGRSGTSVGLQATVTCLLEAFDALHVRDRWHLTMCNVLPVAVIAHPETFNGLPIVVISYAETFNAHPVIVISHAETFNALPVDVISHPETFNGLPVTEIYTLIFFVFLGVVRLGKFLFSSFLAWINSLISFLSVSVNGGLCMIKSTPFGSLIMLILFIF
ncbi:MAG: hypothetical protein M0R39_05545 [Prolixibacteraceae bacterium]|nr:hypothetical protein [Prolixibacteraceae bacterium]